MHFVLQPLALVGLAIGPHILSGARNLILEELSRVNGPISKFQHSLSILLSVLVSAFVPCAIRPSLDTTAVLLILEPVTDVGSAISMLVSALAMGFIVEPRAFIYVAIGVNENALPISLVVLPHAVVA